MTDRTFQAGLSWLEESYWLNLVYFLISLILNYWFIISRRIFKAFNRIVSFKITRKLEEFFILYFFIFLCWRSNPYYFLIHIIRQPRSIKSMRRWSLRLSKRFIIFILRWRFWYLLIMVFKIVVWYSFSSKISFILWIS